MSTHKAWVLDIQIRGEWTAARLFIGGNPLKLGIANAFAKHHALDINSIRVRRILQSTQYFEISESLTALGAEMCDSEPFIFSVGIDSDDTLQFDDKCLYPERKDGWYP